MYRILARRHQRRALPLLSLLFTIAAILAVCSRGNANDDPAVVGQWSPVVPWPCIAVHTHLLPDGRVLTWPKDRPNQAKIWNPTTNAFTSVPNRTTNLFCSGHAFMADGRLLVTGGNGQPDDGTGLRYTHLFDPKSNAWVRANDMNDLRWYPTNTALGNGEMLVTSGLINPIRGNNTVPQVWKTTGGWRDLTRAQLSLPYYPFMHLAPNGAVFNSGPNQTTRYLDTSGLGAWSTVADSGFGYRESGSSVMYDEGKVLIVGGHDPPTATAEVIDLNAPSPAWRMVSPMTWPRRHLTTTLLPDGKVLVTGGNRAPGWDTASGSVLTPEIWDPTTEKWSTVADMQVPRRYHSTALLLPDGRVLCGGGGQYPGSTSADQHQDVEFYSPPYLFKGPRPTVAAAPITVTYGETFLAETPDADSITDVNWIRLGSVTHGFNMNQRINRLRFARVTGGLNVVAPANGNLCPPGHYMLFLLNGNGVPSRAAILRIGEPPPPPVIRLPSAPTNLTAQATSPIRVQLTWVDKATNEDGYRIEQSSNGFTWSQEGTTGANTTTFVLLFLPPKSTYYFRVRAYNKGGVSAYSNTASVRTL